MNEIDEIFESLPEVESIGSELIPTTKEGCLIPFKLVPFLLIFAHSMKPCSFTKALLMSVSRLSITKVSVELVKKFIWYLYLTRTSLRV